MAVTISPGKRFAISIAVTVATAAILALIAILLVPKLGEVEVAQERAGVFRYHRSVVRTSAWSSLDGRALYCRASVVGASSVCSIADDGKSVTVKLVSLPTMFGRELVAVSAASGDHVVYENNPAQVRASWIEESIKDIVEVSLLAGMACYAIMFAFAGRQPRHRNDA